MVKMTPRTSKRVAVAAPRTLARASLARSYAQKYSKTHEWVKVTGGVGTVGITQHAADALGEIVFVDLPKVGATFKAGSAFGAVESVKAASDVYTPVSGEVVEINGALSGKPDTVNASPITDGWMIKVKLSNPKEVDSLLDQAAYDKLASEDHH